MSRGNVESGKEVEGLPGACLGGFGGPERVWHGLGKGASDYRRVAHTWSSTKYTRVVWLVW